jgi:pimeloyl-ACP methyl ester carboxylesterase
LKDSLRQAITPFQQQEVSTLAGDEERPRTVKFEAPLLQEGYPPAVQEYEKGELTKKPLFVYLPGFDGTWMAPFLQFPELSTTFDVRCLTISMRDRSTYDELKTDVIEYILEQIRQEQGETKKSSFFWRWRPSPRSVYIAGESFGGILATDVALTLLEEYQLENIKGMTLINAATCYDRSKLAMMGPMVAGLPKLLYPFALLSLIPLFTDDYAWDQLVLILRAQALPSVIDSAQRESYMGRVAFSIPRKLQYMPQGTLAWRLEEWLAAGCAKMESRLERFRSYKSFPTLIVAGEKDKCLPSIEEAERLSSIFASSHVHVVEGAGHACTCGSRIDLAAVIRYHFRFKGGRTEMKAKAAAGKGVHLGMEPRYDGRDDIGLSPLKYWSIENYKRTDLRYLNNRTLEATKDGIYRDE